MWLSLFRGGQWSDLAELASPALLEVMGMGELVGSLKSVASGYWDGSRFAKARSDREGWLSRTELPVVLTKRRLGAFTSHQDGDAVLALYFHQLFVGEHTLLDLRRGSFRTGERLGWDPAPLTIAWDVAFLAGVREVYHGHYLGDDARYRRGLAQLGLAPVSAALAKLVRGSGGEATAQFSLAELRHGLHEVFVCCRDQHVHLHPNFVALGIYLACLYEHLEGLGGRYDVKSAYLRGATGSW